jgi:protoheme IX farnesyltransferase
MGRTRLRPLVTGDISLARQRWVPGVALVMIFLPVLALLPFNALLSFYLLLGAFIYVGIYTIWLKPRTLLNIVVGGAAGSAAVMSGGAAVGAGADPGVIVLALLVFLWTPSHFWSPAYTSTRSAGYWVLLHTVATSLAALLLVLTPALGWLYFLPVVAATVDLAWRNLRLIQQPEKLTARRFFMASNVYLTVVLLAMMIDVLI